MPQFITQDFASISELYAAESWRKKLEREGYKVFLEEPFELSARYGHVLRAKEIPANNKECL